MKESNFQISQGYDVIVPKPGKAYPILCSEWIYLKGKISKISDEALAFHTVGWLFIGAALSTSISILTGSFSTPPDAKKLTVAWIVVVAALVCGVLALFFSWEQRKVTKVKATDVLAQMELIEKRYIDSSEKEEAVANS